MIGRCAFLCWIDGICGVDWLSTGFLLMRVVDEVFHGGGDGVEKMEG